MLRISSRTRVVAVFGYPLDYSLTAQILNAAFDASENDFTCIPFEIKRDRIADAVKSMRALGVVGANIAMPFKETVVPHLDRLGVTASLVGHVDTVGVEGSELVGHNTDYHAFLYTVREASGTVPYGKGAVLLGAGGTACAIGAALLKEGAKELRLVNRTPGRAKALKDRLQEQFKSARITVVPWESAAAAAAVRDADILVNAVPGDPQTQHGPLFRERDLHPALTVFDANYSQSTPLLMAARHTGCAAISGTRMLLWHAIMSFRLWTLEEAPMKEMEAALNSLLGAPAPV